MCLQRPLEESEAGEAYDDACVPNRAHWLITMNVDHLSCLKSYGLWLCISKNTQFLSIFLIGGMTITLAIPLSAVDLTCCRNTLLMHSPQILSDGSAMLDMNHPLAGKERGRFKVVSGEKMELCIYIHVHLKEK